MSLPHKAEPHDDPEPEYYYRRRLDARELLPAIGAGIGVGLVVFYVARLYVQRTPLQPAPRGRSRLGARASALVTEGDDED